MICLVTGCTGLIGESLCKTLLKKGYKVIGISRNKMPQSNILNNKMFSHIRRDLSVEGLYSDELNDVDVVFHLAGSVFSGGKDEIDYLKNNEISSFNLFSACCKNAKRIVFASTQMVYGNPNSVSVDEEFPLNESDTPYGCSKINSENWLKWFAKKHSITAISLRLSGVVEDAGAVINYFIKMAKMNKSIEIFSMGEISRDYILVDDIVQAFISAAENEALSQGFHVYNIGSGEAVKTIDIAKVVCEQLGSLSKINPVTKPAPRLNFVYNISKAKRELGFKPVGLKQGIVKYMNSIK